MKGFLIALLVIIVIVAIIVGAVAWKLNHLVSPELVAKTMKIYRERGSIEKHTITSVQDLAILTSISSSIKGKDPITVTPCLLNGEEITLITLGGTQMREGQATTMDESKLASEGKTNDYLKAVVKLFDDGIIPKGKPILVTGISLGGMIAQQILMVSRITDNYTIKGIITFGSPLTMPFDRKGVKIVRFADSHDIVPKLGEKSIKRGKYEDTYVKLQNKERIYRSSKYKDPVETHALSYIEDAVWNEYDFFGDTNKTNVLEMQQDLTFYPAPKLTK